MGFAIFWIIIWGFVFGILDNPSIGEIIGFIVVGILPPIVNFIRKYS